jgi:Protein of unknown function (DUF3243)
MKMAQEDRAQQTAENLSQEDKNEILNNFKNFQDYLGNKVKQGERLGLSEEAMTKAAQRVADYLADKEEPRNREEYLLKQLWLVADEENKKPLANTLVKLADQTN